MAVAAWAAAPLGAAEALSGEGLRRGNVERAVARRGLCFVSFLLQPSRSAKWLLTVVVLLSFALWPGRGTLAVP